MLTRMTDEDWAVVLQVFEVSRSRRGDKGRDDRKFLEALHYFSVHNVTWRALPTKFGKWNSVWKRFSRLSQSGVFEAFFEALALMSPTAHLLQMFDSTVVRAHVSAAGAKGGQQGQALGRSRGGFSTKIHIKTDFAGLPIGFHLTGGEASDSRNFEILLDIGPDIKPRAALADKGYAQPRYLSRYSVSIQQHRQAHLLPKGSLQGTSPHRADCRQNQTLQTHSPALRKDSKKLCLIRCHRLRVHFDQILQHLRVLLPRHIR